MPQLLKHIDQIGREKQRDVIYVEFHSLETGYQLDYRRNPSRDIVIDWLAENNIPHWECGGVASDFWPSRYRGEIYIDVVYDVNDPLYKKIESFLEHADGTTRLDGAWLRGLSFQVCMQNAHHDDPDYWAGI